jgi:hypothetical protein
MVVACVALLFALGGVGVAATGLPANSVGTLQIKANAVTSAKVKNGSLLGADFKSGQIPRGPAGPTGPAGAAGPAGPKGDPGSASQMWAVIGGDGSVTRMKGVSSVSHPDDGLYEISFTQSAASCAVVATPDDSQWTAGVAYKGDGVEVTITDLDGDPDNEAFTIAAIC